MSDHGSDGMVSCYYNDEHGQMQGNAFCYNFPTFFKFFHVFFVLRYYAVVGLITRETGCARSLTILLSVSRFRDPWDAWQCITILSRQQLPVNLTGVQYLDEN